MLVDRFYGKVRNNPQLNAVFEPVVGDRWPEHLEKMYRFWQTLLLNERTYTDSPFPPHARLPVDRSHFDAWVALFCETVDACFRGPKAEEAKLRAERIAGVFYHKIKYLQDHRA